MGVTLRVCPRCGSEDVEIDRDDYWVLIVVCPICGWSGHADELKEVKVSV